MNQQIPPSRPTRFGSGVNVYDLSLSHINMLQLMQEGVNFIAVQESVGADPNPHFASVSIHAEMLEFLVVPYHVFRADAATPAHTNALIERLKKVLPRGVRHLFVSVMDSRTEIGSDAQEWSDGGVVERLGPMMLELLKHMPHLQVGIHTRRSYWNNEVAVHVPRSVDEEEDSGEEWAQLFGRLPLWVSCRRSEELELLPLLPDPWDKTNKVCGGEKMKEGKRSDWLFWQYAEGESVNGIQGSVGLVYKCL